MEVTEIIETALKDFATKSNFATKSELVTLLTDKLKAEMDKAQYATTAQLEAENKKLQTSVNDMAKQLKSLLGMRYVANGSYSGMFKSAEMAKDFGMFVLATCVKRDFALKHLEEMGIEMKTLTGTGGNDVGGILVPNVMSTNIIETMKRYGKYRANAMVYPVGGGETTVPKLISDPTVYCPGQNVSITASDMNFDGLALNAQGWKALLAISNELDADSAISLGELIGRAFVRAFAKKEDACGFVGDGTKTFFGNIGMTQALRNVDADVTKCQGLTVQATVGNWGKIAIDDLFAVIANLPEEYDNDDAKFYCSKKFYYLVMVLLALNKGSASLKSEILQTGYTKMPQFQGYAVEYVASMPKTVAAADSCPLLFGDLSSAAILGDRAQLDIATSREAGFKDDATYIRATERVAINNHGVGDTTEPGAVVGLWNDIS